MTIRNVGTKGVLFIYIGWAPYTYPRRQYKLHCFTHVNIDLLIGLGVRVRLLSSQVM